MTEAPPLNLADLMRSNIMQMTPYVPIKPFHVLSAELGLPIEAIVKLDANENPYGASPKTLAALENLQAETPIYPDPINNDLREHLAGLLGVTHDNLVIGAGADELIELLFKLFVNAGDAIINSPPTFGMYTFLAAVTGAQEVVIQRDADFRLDVEAIEQAVQKHRAKLVFITTPNNPDGGTIEGETVERLLALPAIIVLDEAYIAFTASDLAGEFGPKNYARWVTRYPNLVVLRTFSKWAGIAGLRCGYGVFDPRITRYLLTIKQPYNLNVAARAAALAALDDLDWIRTRVNWMIDERARLYEALDGLPFLRPHVGSQANFVLVEVLGRSAADLKAALAARGVLVRYFAKPRLENHIRISVGTSPQTDRLIDALKDL